MFTVHVAESSSFYLKVIMELQVGVDSGARDFYRKILRFLPAQILPPAVSFLAIPLLTRILTEAEYGRYILIVTTVSITNLFALGWIPNCALRFYRPMKAQFGTFVFHLFLCLAITVGVIFLAILLGWPFITDRYQQLLYLSVPLGILAAGNGIVNSFFRASDQSVQYNTMLVLGVVLRFVPGLLCLYYLDGKLEHFALAWLLSSLALFAFELFLSGMWRHAFWGTPSRVVLADYASYGIPLLIAGFCNVMMGSANNYILAGFRDDVAVAMFGICAQMSSIPMQLISKSITIVLMPAAVDAYHDNPRHLPALFRRASGFTITLILPMVAIGAGGAGWFLANFAKESYARAAPALELVLLASLFLALTHIYRAVLMVYQQTFMIARVAFVGAAISLSLNLILIPQFGFMGAAWTYLFTQTLLLGLTVWRARMALQFSFAWKRLAIMIVVSGMLFFLTPEILSVF